MNAATRRVLTDQRAAVTPGIQGVRSMPICPKCGNDQVKTVGQSNTKPVLVFLRCARCGHTSTTARAQAVSRVASHQE
jgi:DNA-directed RNA polymerase subunit M/transcription elongation factor TFIIS